VSRQSSSPTPTPTRRLRSAASLTKLGFKVWVDEAGLKVGDSLIERIPPRFAEIDFFLALVSESSRESKWCQKELALAVTGELGREGIRVLPVQVDGAQTPAALADVYYLKLNQTNVDEVAQALQTPSGIEPFLEPSESKRSSRPRNAS
jgi:TIR domain